MTKSERLKQLIEKRESFFTKNDILSKEKDKKIDQLTKKIWKLIRKEQFTLSVEEILEAITILGGAPSVLYDDNGHFFIGGDGIQNLPTFNDTWKTEETTFQGTWWVPPNGWKKTIRKALTQYLKERE